MNESHLTRIKTLHERARALEIDCRTLYMEMIKDNPKSYSAPYVIEAALDIQSGMEELARIIPPSNDGWGAVLAFHNGIVEQYKQEHDIPSTQKRAEETVNKIDSDGTNAVAIIADALAAEREEGSGCFGDDGVTRTTWEALAEKKAQQLAVVTKERDEALASQEHYMLRSVGAMAIAENEDAHELIPRDCPMLTAVSELRLYADKLEGKNLDLETQLAACQERARVLREALELVRTNGMLAVHSHWDSTMRSGVGCPICIKQREVSESIRAALSQPAPKGGISVSPELIKPQERASETSLGISGFQATWNNTSGGNVQPEPAAHNPNNLTPEQVGVADGWRLLDEDEIIRIIGSGEVQAWDDQGTGFKWHVHNWGSIPFRGSNRDYTYRTRLSRAELRKARGLPEEPISKPQATELKEVGNMPPSEGKPHTVDGPTPLTPPIADEATHPDDLARIGIQEEQP